VAITIRPDQAEQGAVSSNVLQPGAAFFPPGQVSGLNAGQVRGPTGPAPATSPKPPPAPSSRTRGARCHQTVAVEGEIPNLDHMRIPLHTDASSK
jgi:hypothetical protein